MTAFGQVKQGCLVISKVKNVRNTWTKGISSNKLATSFVTCCKLNNNNNNNIGLVGRVFANGPGDLGPIPGHVIPKFLKMVPDTSLLNTQQYKVRIKVKVEQSRERSSALPYTAVL